MSASSPRKGKTDLLDAILSVEGRKQRMRGLGGQRDDGSESERLQEGDLRSERKRWVSSRSKGRRRRREREADLSWKRSVRSEDSLLYDSESGWYRERRRRFVDGG